MTETAMQTSPEDVKRLVAQNPSIAGALEAADRAARAYREALAAMGLIPQPKTEAESSADVAVQLSPAHPEFGC